MIKNRGITRTGIFFDKLISKPTTVYNIDQTVVMGSQILTFTVNNKGVVIEIPRVIQTEFHKSQPVSWVGKNNA